MIEYGGSMRYLKIIILALIIIGGYYYQGRFMRRKPVELKIKEANTVENIVLNAKIKTNHPRVLSTKQTLACGLLRHQSYFVASHGTNLLFFQDALQITPV